MYLLRNLALSIWAASLLLAAVASAAADAGPVFVIIAHKSTSADSVSLKQLRRFYLGEIRQWSDHSKVILVQRDPASESFKNLLQLVVKMSASEYKRFQMNTEFRGEEPLTLKTLKTPESACNFVFNVPGAVGIVELDALQSPACKDKVKFLSLDDGHGGGKKP